MPPPRSDHIPEADLEAYSTGARLPGTMLADIEEHLLACGGCDERARDIKAQAGSVNAALRLIQARARARAAAD